MLMNFRFKNFLSFRDEASLDLTANKGTELSDHVVQLGNNRLLKLAIIFGANASGKSNLFNAFEFMSYYVIESFKFGGDDERQSEDDYFLNNTPFLFDDDSKLHESLFEVTFTYPHDETYKVYQYGFTLKNNTILSEWLKYKTKSSRVFKNIFERKENKIIFSTTLKKWESNIKISIEPEVLVVSLGAKLKISKLKSVRDWFLDNETVAFGDPSEAFFRSRLIPEGFVDKADVQQEVADFFNSFGNSIKGFVVEKLPETEEVKDHYRIETKHGVNGEYRLPLHKESSGTLKMFQLFPYLKEVLEAGSILFIDELNEKLHPALVRRLLNLFADKQSNPNNAQLIATTHDTWQLSNEVLRRDEIWLVYKSADEVSTIYSLADYEGTDGNKVRKDESYEKNYFSGKYGGIVDSNLFLK